MPGLSGIELAILLRDAYPDCAVLLFSGQIATIAMLKVARGRGYNFEVIAKPIHPVEVLKRVRLGLGLGSQTDAATATF